MAYLTPTTEEQMIDVLEQIFYDYRLKIDAYEDAGLEDIILERMAFTEKSDEQLQVEARELVCPWYDEEYSKAKNELINKIDAVDCERKNLLTQKDERKYQLENSIAESIEKVRNEAVKLGYINTDLMFQKIAEIEEYRVQRLAEIEEEFSVKETAIQEKYALLTESLTNLEGEYQTFFENKIRAKFLELKDAYEEVKREVFKYNNGLDEKEKRSKNANISANASLKLRYLEIRTQSYSKEELVDMGYYKDVIACVRGYFDSIEDKADAYRKFLNNSKVAIYLEDYYENILSIYRARAGL